MMLLALTGCAYRVALTSLPMPAQVTLPDGRVVVTPTEADLRWAPFAHQVVIANAPGHRTLAVDLREHEIKFWRLVGTTVFHPATIVGRPRGEIRLVLVPEHGPAGTWTSDELP